MSPRVYGLMLAFVGILILSPDAALTRMFDGDIWTMVFWRSVGNLVVFGLMAFIWFKRDLFTYFKDLGWAGWCLFVLTLFSPLLWLGSNVLSGGPQTLALLAIAPLAASVASWLILGERLQWPAIVFGSIALIGVVITVVDGLAQTDFSLFGTSLSLLLPVAFALIFVLSRKMNRPNSWPILSLSGGVLIIPAFFLAPTVALTTQAQLVSIIPMITVVATLSFCALVLASRYIPAGDVTLIAMLEPVIGVFFLWLLVREVPTSYQWVGGSIVFGSVLMFTLWQLAQERQSQAASQTKTKA